MPKPRFLNVRSCLDYVVLVTEGYQKYSACPAIDTEIAKLKLIAKAIIREHDAKRKKGNRHDLYVGK